MDLNIKTMSRTDPPEMSDGLWNSFTWLDRVRHITHSAIRSRTRSLEYLAGDLPFGRGESAASRTSVVTRLTEERAEVIEAVRSGDPLISFLIRMNLGMGPIKGEPYRPASKSRRRSRP